MASLKIGFVGLGTMGGRLASCLVRVGDLSVFDADEAKMIPFEGRARLGTSIADVGKDADVVGVCVRNDEQVDSCADALAPTMQPGSIIMIHSTVSPDTIKAAAARCAEHGVILIDSAVTVTAYDKYNVDGVPFVYSLVGGDNESFERVQPLLNAYSTDHVHVGPLGAGVSLKIVNNMVSLTESMIAEEAYRIAARASVPADILSAVLTRNGCLTPQMAWMAKRSGEEAPSREEQIMREVQAANGIKDLSLAEDLARGAYTACGLTSFAKANYWFTITVPGPTAAW